MKKILRDVYYGFRLTLGRRTNAFRKHPDFIIIGVQKGGTTSMFNYLSEHPQIKLPWKKQIHFFDLNFKKGLAWYKSHFPIIFNKKKIKTGESSPYYIFHPHAAKRISKAFPEVKLIVLLRNPVSRAFSHYNMVKKNEKGNTFEDAISKEEGRLNGEVEKLRTDENYLSFNHQTFTYLSRGRYHEQIENWLTYFDREQILFLKSEDFFADPQTTLNLVSNFLEISNFSEYNNLKKVWQKGKYNKIDKETKDRLKHYFHPYNKALYNLIGQNFEWEEELN